MSFDRRKLLAAANDARGPAPTAPPRTQAIDVINTTEVLDGVKARYALFAEGLKAINVRRRVFADIRGEGVWLGCELDAPWAGKAMDVVRAAGDAGLLLLVAGPDVVRLAPSLVISLDEILEGLARFELALGRALR